MVPSTFRPAVAVLLAALLACVGCGPRRGSVAGVVLSGKTGKAVPLGHVTLIASDGSAFAAPIAADGSYALPDVPVGLARLGVTSLNPNAPAVAARPGPAKPPHGAAPAAAGVAVSAAARKGWFPIPARLADPLASGLAVTVAPGATRHDIRVD